VGEVSFQVSRNHYYGNYDTKERFFSYWHQIQEIIECKSKTVLEIGIGNGFVSEYLRQKGYDITTSDLDAVLHPNVISTVLDMPFSERAFDVVACFEVLEHLPFEEFESAITEICRISRSYILLSIPDSTRAYRFCLQLPKIREFRKLICPPTLKKPIHNFDGEHYWEIGKAGYSLNTILKVIGKVGLKLRKTYRIFENPYHRFFILTK
jgi:SAM-dependent methyltransferase